jgi:cobalt-zinc-cadmium efflux system protein
VHQHQGHPGPHSHLSSAAAAGAGRLQIVLLLTGGYLLVEVAGAVITGSLSLLADAGHMLIDVTGLTVALLAIRFAARSPSAAKSYGYYRLEILAALLNGLLMVGISAYILVEAIQRFSDPPSLPGLGVVAFALPGLVVNAIAIWLLMEAQKASLNMRGAFLEVVADMGGSAAVVVVGVILAVGGPLVVDPIASLAIGLFILPRTWSLLAEAVHVLLEGVPRNVDIETVRSHILGVEGVTGMHDLHVWNLTSGMNVMSAHVVVGDGVSSQRVLSDLCACLADHFDIEHSTFQIESPDRSETEHAAH